MVKLSANNIKLLQNFEYNHHIPTLLGTNDKAFVKNILEKIDSLGFKTNETYRKSRNEINRELRNKLNEISQKTAYHPTHFVPPPLYNNAPGGAGGAGAGGAGAGGAAAAGNYNPLEYNALGYRIKKKGPLNASAGAGGAGAGGAAAAGNYNPLGYGMPLNMGNGLNLGYKNGKKLRNGMTNEELSTFLQSEYAESPYTNVFLLGHGSIISKEFIVLPNKINITFYTEKGQTLTVNETNRIFRSFNLTTVRGDNLHRIPEKMLMNNMTIELLSFFYDDTRNFLQEFDYSGIVTLRNPTPFIALDERVFRTYKIVPLSSRIYVNPENGEGIDWPDYDHNTNGNYIRIIDFGKHFYGIMYEKKRGIYIINTMTNMYIKNILRTYIATKRNGVPIHLSNNMPPSILNKIKRLSVHFNDESIITKDLLEENNYIFKLSTLLDIIKEHYGNHTDVMCHGIVCRSYRNNRNSLAGSVLASSTVRPTAISQLIRTKSANNVYINRFENILERFRIHISNLLKHKSVNMPFKRKINEICRMIISFIKTNKFLLEIHADFIDNVINDIPQDINLYIQKIENTLLYHLCMYQ